MKHINTLFFKTSNKDFLSTDEVPSVPEEEKKYYLPDSYYSLYAHEGTIFEYKIQTFEERKRTSFPSKRGLYVAEILLIEYCKKAEYPNPKNGYPSFWWYEYGIRDVHSVLRELEMKGFIRLSSLYESLDYLTVPQLKEILNDCKIQVSGKKANLIAKIKENINVDKLQQYNIPQKYVPTELGIEETYDNAYVLYMHRCHNKTLPDCGETEFNVWTINKLLGTGDKRNWKDIIEDEINRVDSINSKRIKQLEEMNKS